MSHVRAMLACLVAVLLVVACQTTPAPQPTEIVPPTPTPATEPPPATATPAPTPTAASASGGELLGELPFGEVVRGSLDEAGASTAWTISGAAGQGLYVLVETVRGRMVPFVTLSDEAGRLLASGTPAGDFSAIVQTELPKDGDYTLTVAAYGEETGTYEATMYDAQPGGGELEYGASAQGVLVGEDAEDSWEFTATPGDFVDVEIQGDGELDTYLQLMDEEGNLVASDDDSGDDLNPRLIGVPLLAGGTYYLNVTAYNTEAEGVGTYTLELNQGEVNGGGTLTYDETITDELGEGPHVWTFEGQEGEQIAIELRSRSENADLDPRLTLYDTGGRQLASDDDSGGDYNALISNVTLPESGTYTVLAIAYSGSGAYDLTVRRAEPVAAGTISYGQVVTGTMIGGQPQYWTFEGQEGERIEARVSTASREESTLDMYLSLLDPTGEELAYDDDSGGSYDPLLSDVTLPASGTYRLDISALRGSGSYELRLDVQPQP